MGKDDPTFSRDAVATAVQEYKALVTQGGVVAAAAFGVAVVSLQQRLNVSVAVAARLLQYFIRDS